MGFKIPIADIRPAAQPVRHECSGTARGIVRGTAGAMPGARRGAACGIWAAGRRAGGGACHHQVSPISAGLVDRGDQQTDLDGQQLDVAELDLDVAGDHDALVEYPLQDFGKAFRMRARTTTCVLVIELGFCRGAGPLSEFAQWSQSLGSDLRRSDRIVVSAARSLVKLKEGQAQPLDLLRGKRAAVDPPQGLPFQQLAEQFDQRQNQSQQAVPDVLRVDADLRRGCRRRRRAGQAGRESPGKGRLRWS